jgi:spore coat polysaccharide biosynthesis predicted glycosyltransferase SpsG
VLNQNSYAHERYYQNRQIYTELLLGCEFTCLRREFWPARGRTKSIRADADRVLVTFGGSDADNRTLDVIRSTRVAGAASAEMIVVAGAGNPHLAALAAAAENTNDRVRIEANVTDMVALFAWTDIAVSGGGSTAWELAFMGVPTLLAVLADNQVLVAASLDERGIAINLGDAAAISGTDWAFQTNALLSDARRRQRMSEAGQQFVDGYGADRVVEKMLSQPKRPTR